MDEYRKIQKTPAEKCPDDGTSAGVFYVCPATFISKKESENYFHKNNKKVIENFFHIIYNNYRNYFQKRRIKEKVI